MDGHIHVTTFDALAVTTATDLFHITVATDVPIVLLEMKLGQSTDLGDAAEEVLRIGLYRGVTGGSGGTALTEIPLLGGDGASSSVVLANNTSISTGGNLIDMDPWNIRMPFLWCPVPELRPVVTTTYDPVSFRLMAAPADSITVSGSLKWMEIK